MKIVIKLMRQAERQTRQWADSTATGRQEPFSHNSYCVFLITEMKYALRLKQNANFSVKRQTAGRVAGVLW